ncbi:MAG TPA: hypothetical protein VKD26_01945, partial [Streptosporangiaceae bacterium]|nr:hypothetical protein [Streptosporangiaceae bacterium]
MGEIRADRDIFTKRAVDRRGGVKPHRGAQIQPSGLAEPAAAARPLWLDRDAVTDPRRVDPVTHGDDAARCLVPENER